jgi:hypothetical protein
MLGQGVQPGIELDLPGQPVVMRDEPAIIVEQHLFGNSAKVAESAFDTGKPTLLALVAKRLDIEPPRVAQRRYEQINLHIVVADHRPTLAKVDLQLLAGRRLEADRRARLCLQFASQVTHLALDRPQAQPDPLVPLELLANHIGVAGMPAETLRNPILKPGQRPRPTATAIRYPAARRQISANCHMAAPQFAGDPPHTPSQRLQPQHRCNLVRRLHRLPPR